MTVHEHGKELSCRHWYLWCMHRWKLIGHTYVHSAGAMPICWGWLSVKTHLSYCIPVPAPPHHSWIHYWLWWTNKQISCATRTNDTLLPQIFFHRFQRKGTLYIPPLSIFNSRMTILAEVIFTIDVCYVSPQGLKLDAQITQGLQLTHGLNLFKYTTLLYCENIW